MQENKANHARIVHHLFVQNVQDCLIIPCKIMQKIYGLKCALSRKNISKIVQDFMEYYVQDFLHVASAGLARFH